MVTRRTFSPEEAVRKYESLPPDIKKIVYSSEMTDAIRKAGEKFKIHLDQLVKLEGEVSFVMLGFTEPKDFGKVLVERLAVDRVTAAGLVQELDASIFQKIRESLKKLYTEETSVSSQGEGSALHFGEPAALSIPQTQRVAPLTTAPAKKSFAPLNLPTEESSIIPSRSLSQPILPEQQTSSAP